MHIYIAENTKAGKKRKEKAKRKLEEQEEEEREVKRVCCCNNCQFYLELPQIKLTAPKNNEFENVATDTMVYIFAFLPLREQATIAITSKQFYNTFCHDYIWKPVVSAMVVDEQAVRNAMQQQVIVTTTTTTIPVSYFAMYNYLRTTYCSTCQQRSDHLTYNKYHQSMMCPSCETEQANHMQSKATAKRRVGGLNDEDFDALPFKEQTNTAYHFHNIMKCYDLRLVQRKAKQKLGDKERDKRNKAAMARILKREEIVQQCKKQGVTKYDLRSGILYNFVHGTVSGTAKRAVQQYKLLMSHNNK